jgi:hypothetical protein
MVLLLLLLLAPLLLVPLSLVPLRSQVGAAEIPARPGIAAPAEEQAGCSNTAGGWSAKA